MTSLSIAVFLVEDNLSDVWLVEECLKRNSIPYTMEHRATAREAIEAVKLLGVSASVPDIILIDFNLPGGHGIHVLEAVSKNSALDGVPRSVLTSSLSPDERARVTTLGAKRVICKPPGFHLFITEVGTAIQDMIHEARGAKSASAAPPD